LTIVRNRCFDVLRHKESHPATSLDYNYNTSENADDFDTASFRAQKSLSPEQWVEQQEAVEAVCRCVDRLQADYRKAIILVDIQGMDYSEAAQALGRPVGTVKSRLARGRAQVLQMLSLLPGASSPTARSETAAARAGKKTFFRDQLDTSAYSAEI
jgi:RNA polymerase sigma-70 factor (ECF subfamily)